MYLKNPSCMERIYERGEIIASAEAFAESRQVDAVNLKQETLQHLDEVGKKAKAAVQPTKHQRQQQDKIFEEKARTFPAHLRPRLIALFKQKTAYEMLRSLVGSEMCIRDRTCP